MKANLPAQEPERLARWESLRLYEEIRRRRQGAPKFILHDGPPYANGEIHIGHALNKILKDIVVRYKTMRGFDAPYVPGWDCHGLPIEHALLKEMGKRKGEVPRQEFRRQAREYAERYVVVQRQGFQRLGVLGDWGRPYRTMDFEYQAAIAEAFLTLFERGFIERRLKPVPWCAECETALAEAELEYETKNSPSIYVRFRINPHGRHWTAKAAQERPIVAVVWTTTPWTLPANVGLAFHPEVTYCLVDVGRAGRLIVAKPLVETLRQKLEWETPTIVSEHLGEEFEALEADHPFIPGRISKGILAEFVSCEEGTGIVHIAPGHGEEDYQVGHLQYGLPILSPVDSNGRFTADYPPCAGQLVFDANRQIVATLQRAGHLLAGPEPYEHSYPHCWRCKQPIIFRAAPQWFFDVDHQDLRQRLLEAIERTIRFIPAWGKNRIGSMMATRPDWCLSRQRYWGVPIPIVTCACGKVYATEIRDAVVQAFREQGADAWFERPAGAWLPHPPACCAAPQLRKEEDIIDVWFDSGASHHAVLVPRQESDLKFPADLYLEGSDQHRGWFQTSLLVSMGAHGTWPFKSVLTHGFVVDGGGRKMSKSLGNVISPQDVLKTYGADVLRLWVASCDYAEDVRLSPSILDQMAELYRKIRNTLRYLLGNLADFDPARDSVPTERLLPVDRWVVGRSAEVLAQATAAYESYEFHKVVRLVSHFCTVDLSNFYLDVVKDRLYTLAPAAAARRSAQTGLYASFQTLVTVIAPLLPFTADEAWEALGKGPVPNVHLAEWPNIPERPDAGFQAQWDRFFEVRDVVLKALEEQRIAGVIGDPGEAAVTVTTYEDAAWQALQPLAPSLAELLLVSVVALERGRGSRPIHRTGAPGATAQVRRADGKKCARCWRYTLDVGCSGRQPELCARCVEVLMVGDGVSL